MKRKPPQRLDETRSLERFNRRHERGEAPLRLLEGDGRVMMLKEVLRVSSTPARAPQDAPDCGCSPAYTTLGTRCEACRSFTLLGILHVIRWMDADPCFARLMGELSMHSLARSAEPLTNREMDVLHLMVKRHSYREIAEILFISPLTVKTHVHNLFRKLGVNRRRFAIQRAHELGLVQAS